MKPKNQKKPKTSKAVRASKGGRPRKEAFEWPIYDTMAQCSAQAAVPMGVLKQAKNLGCPAFKHSRVYFGEFLPWLFSNLMDDANVDWSNELQKVNTLRQRVKLAEDEKRVIDRNTISDGIAKVMATIFGELDRVFVSELPASGKGMDEVKLRVLAGAEIEALKDKLRKEFEALSNGQVDRKSN